MPFDNVWLSCVNRFALSYAYALTTPFGSVALVKRRALSYAYVVVPFAQSCAVVIWLIALYA